MDRACAEHSPCHVDVSATRGRVSTPTFCCGFIVFFLQLQVTIRNKLSEGVDTMAGGLEDVDNPTALPDVADPAEDPAVTVEDEVLVSLDDDMDERILLAPDEEEDEDDETRSWRR